MPERVESWVTMDGMMFPTKREAIEWEALRSKVDMIQEKLEVDECLAVEIADFIEMFTKGWKE